MIILGVLVAFVAFLGAANAESISGKVISADATGSKLSISQTDSATGIEKTLDFAVNAEAASALAELQAGDEISVEAEQDAATGAWTATAIAKADAAEAEAASTEAAPAAETAAQ